MMHPSTNSHKQIKGEQPIGIKPPLQKRECGSAKISMEAKL